MYKQPLQGVLTTVPLPTAAELLLTSSLARADDLIYIVLCKASTDRLGQRQEQRLQ